MIRRNFWQSLKNFCTWGSEPPQIFEKLISFCGLFLGAVYLFFFFVGIVLLCLLYSPYVTLLFALYTNLIKLIQCQMLGCFLRGLLGGNHAGSFSFCLSAHLFMIIYSLLIMQNLTVACFAEALSCRFIVKSKFPQNSNIVR